MTIEDRIRAAARQVADEVEPPRLDIGLVRRRVHAGRRRKLGITAAVAATVAVCLLVPRLLGSPSSAPDPVDRPPGPGELPPGKVVPSAPVWADADGLHLGGRVLSLNLDPGRGPSCGLEPACTSISSLALVAAGAAYGDEKSGRVWFQPSKGPAKLIGDGSQVGPAGDPDGTAVAWFDDTELVMYDTATGRELARAAQPGEDPQPLPRRENAQGNEILEVTSNGVTWHGPGWEYHFDRLSGTTSRTSVTTASSGDIVDVREGWVAASQRETGVTEVISPRGDTALTLKPAQLIGPMQFSSDGRYLAGINERDGYSVTVADLRTGELFIPFRKDFYPWIGWGAGDTLMVIQDYEGTDDGDPHDESQLMACDISRQSCQQLDRTGGMTVPSS